MAFDFGLQKDGFNPSGVTHGRPSENVFDPNFNFEKYDIHYNPWGTGQDAEAQKLVFEQRIQANSTEALNEFSRLKRDAFGYSWSTVSSSASAQASKANRFTVGRGDSAGARIGTSKDIEYGRGDAWDPLATTDKYGTKILRVGSGSPYGMDEKEQYATTVKNNTVDPKELSAVDEYMLWRYDIATTQLMKGGIEIGGGETDLYTGLSHLGQDVDKTVAQQAGQGQRGPVTAGGVGRHERQAGKQSFTRSVTL